MDVSDGGVAAPRQLSPVLWLWKSRLPIIIVPVLTSLRQLSGNFIHETKPSTQPQLEIALLFIIAIGTGIGHLPFSVTWWFVILAAVGLQTELLLGVATVLSMSVALVWYSVQFQHPHAVMALWGGAKGEKDCKNSMPRACWRIWDLCVHGFPAIMMVWWFGPSIAYAGKVDPGAVTVPALLAALPMNILWLWGVELRRTGGTDRRWGISKWPASFEFADSNVVYDVKPDLPQKIWQQMYRLHFAVCAVWISCLALHREVLIVNAIFALAGLVWWPFTNAWWVVFIVALVQGDRMPLLRGMCWCAAAPVAIGWYGTQLLHPNIFIPLVHVWTVRPVERFGPEWLALRFSAFSKTKWFAVLARLGDFCLHFVPTMSALYFFRSSITPYLAIATLPGNLVYWAGFAVFSGARCLADTNWIYGVSPNIPNSTWFLIFGSHWFFCGLVLCICKTSSTISAQAMSPWVPS